MKFTVWQDVNKSLICLVSPLARYFCSRSTVGSNECTHGNTSYAKLVLLDLALYDVLVQ